MARLLFYSCLTSASEDCPRSLAKALGEVPATRILDGPPCSRRAARDVLFCIQHDLPIGNPSSCRQLLARSVSDVLPLINRFLPSVNFLIHWRSAMEGISQEFGPLLAHSVTGLPVFFWRICDPDFQLIVYVYSMTTKKISTGFRTTDHCARVE